MYIDMSCWLYPKPMECLFRASSIQSDYIMGESDGDADDMNRINNMINL